MGRRLPRFYDLPHRFSRDEHGTSLMCFIAPKAATASPAARPRREKACSVWC